MSSGNDNSSQFSAVAAVSVTRLLVVFGACTAVVLLATALFGNSAIVLAAFLSAITCCISAVIAHFLGIYPQGEVFRLLRLYTASAVRIVVPVMFLFVFKTVYPDLFRQGMVYFVVLFYLVGLLTDLLLQLRRLKLVDSGPAAGAG